MKIFHLLNDFSGSTSIINDLVSFNEKNVQVITSKSKGRIKSSYISNYNSYIYVDSFIKKLVMLIRVYLSTILYCIFSSEKIILSTILFAPVALLVRKSNISIYLMERQHGPKIIFNLLIFLLRHSNVNIYVLSNYMKTDLNLPESKVVYPSLRKEFNTIDYKSIDSNINNVLFVSSFKKYKGWPIFCEVSNRFIDYEFNMILSHQDDLDPKIKKFNGRVLYNVKNMVPYLKENDIVCNLSIPSLWKETLGLTIVEAMCFGKIVICPDAGAFKEYIVDGKNGFLLPDVNEVEFEKCLKKISNLNNKEIIKIKKNAVNTAKNFEYKTMQHKIKKEIIL